MPVADAGPGWRPRGVLLDFYGTLVEADAPILRRICERVARAAGADDELVHAHWSSRFVELWDASWGRAFRTVREIVRLSLADTIHRFAAGLDPAEAAAELHAYWRRPAICPETRAVLAHCPVPACIVSDVDEADLWAAMDHLGLSFDHVVTSEGCRAYKPRGEMFAEALRRLGLPAREVLHVGDSFRRDVGGAVAAGIPALWLNRLGAREELPAGRVHEAPDLTALPGFFRGSAPVCQ